MNNTPNRFFALIPWLLLMAVPPVAFAAESKSAQSASSVSAATAPQNSKADTALGVVAAGVEVTAGLGMVVVDTADATLGDALSKLQPAKKLESYHSKRNDYEWISFKCDTARIIYTGRLASRVSGCNAVFLFDAQRYDESLKGRFMPAKKADNCDEARKICDAVNLNITEADGKISIHEKGKLMGVIDFSAPSIGFQAK